MLWFLIPFVLGALTLLQTGLNRRFGEEHGLAFAIAVNGAVLCAIALAVMAAGIWQPAWIPEYVRTRGGAYRFQLWHLLPGLCGFLMVFFMPWSVRSLGAAPVFMVFVTAQLVGSVLWDFSSGGAVAWPRLTGLALCLAGAGVVTFARA